MNFTSQICTTKEQSERLLAVGLKQETADMMYCKTASGELITAKDYDYLEHLDFPAWSLHRLLCLLPREYIYDIDFQRIMQDFVFGTQDMYEEMISCIETLIEAGYIYEEYLEK